MIFPEIPCRMTLGQAERNQRPLFINRALTQHTLARVGHIDEWHLDYQNPAPHLTFGLPPWLSEIAIVCRSPFFETRFVPVSSVVATEPRRFREP